MNFLSRFFSRKKVAPGSNTPEEYMKWHRNSILFKTAEDRYRQAFYNYLTEAIMPFLKSDKLPCNITLMRAHNVSESKYINIIFIYNNIEYDMGILWKELIGIIMSIINTHSPYLWSISYNLFPKSLNHGL